MIFATRDKDEAISIADRIVVMHYRQIKQIGTLEQILQNPSNIWAAQAFDEDYAFEKRGWKLRTVNLSQSRRTDLK